MSDIEATPADELEQHGRPADADTASPNVDVGLEEPEADVVEQHHDVASGDEPDEGDVAAPSITNEANEADLVEGARTVAFDEDDYR